MAEIKTPPINTQPQTRDSNKLLIILLVLVSSLSIGVAIYSFYQIGQLQEQLNQLEDKPPTQTTPAKTQDTPTPSPNPTANWEEFENEEYGWKISYPNSWYLDETHGFRISSVKWENYRTGNYDKAKAAAIMISPYMEIAPDITIEELLLGVNKEFREEGGGPSPAQFVFATEIGGNKAALVRHGVPYLLQGDSKVYLVVNNKNKLLEVRLKVGKETNIKDYEETFEDILSTLEFTAD